MRKLFALISSLVLVCASVSVLPAREIAVITANAETTSGTLGENLTWVLDDEGTLTISGTGEMSDYSNYLWKPNSYTEENTTIKQIIIEEGITSIGDETFSHCINLTSVIIPESLTSIGYRAFFGCTNLSSITISESVTTIGGSAFYGTVWLEEKQKENPLVIVNNMVIDGKICTGDIIIPNTIISICREAFMGCTALTSITLPEGLTTIDYWTFYGCENLTSITIPESVTTIQTFAFRGCSSLLPVTIPESVTTIGNGAFSYCPEMYSVTIKNPNCEISADAFRSDSRKPTIHGYENSTAQIYAEKNGYPFHTLGAIPETTENPNNDTTWNTINPDLNRDGKIDAKDASLVLVFSAEFGAGNVKSFQEFMNIQYPNG